MQEWGVGSMSAENDPPAVVTGNLIRGRAVVLAPFERVGQNFDSKSLLLGKGWHSVGQNFDSKSCLLGHP